MTNLDRQWCTTTTKHCLNRRFVDINLDRGEGVPTDTVTTLATAIGQLPKLKGIRYLGQHQYLPVLQLGQNNLEYLELWCPTGWRSQKLIQSRRPVTRTRVHTLVWVDRSVSEYATEPDRSGCIIEGREESVKQSWERSELKYIIASIIGPKRLVLRSGHSPERHQPMETRIWGQLGGKRGLPHLEELVIETRIDEIGGWAIDRELYLVSFVAHELCSAC